MFFSLLKWPCRLVHDLLNEKTSQATIDDSFDNWTCHALINIRLRCFWLKDMVIRKGKVGNSMRPANLVPKMQSAEVDSVKLWNILKYLKSQSFTSTILHRIRISSSAFVKSRSVHPAQTEYKRRHFRPCSCQVWKWKACFQLEILDLEILLEEIRRTTTERMVLKLCK